jgi:histidyl-tRNA synthetase
MASGEVMLKNMLTGEQQKMNLDALLQAMR